MKNLRRDIIHIKKYLKEKYTNVQEETLFHSFFSLVLEGFFLPKNKVFHNSLFKEAEVNHLKHFIATLMTEDIAIENVLGWIYQFFHEGNGKQERFSQYYTENWIVKYIVDNSLDQFFIQHPEKSLKDVRILEPCCGSGNFIFYMIDKLIDIYQHREGLSPKESLPLIIQHNLAVVDLDETALEIFQISLGHKLRTLDYAGLESKLQVIHGNYLEADFCAPYDLILGNPPYLENRKINKYLDKEILKESFETAKGRFDLVSVFIEKSIQNLNEKGILGYIVPASILLNNNFAEIRQKILKTCAISQVINLGEGIFSNVSMDMCILILVKNKDDNRKNNLILAKNLRQAANKKRGLKESNFKKIRQSYYYNTLKNVFDIHSSTEVFQLRDRIRESYPPLKENCEIIAGIATGNIRNKLISNRKENGHQVPILEGKDIWRYGYQWKGLYLLNDRSSIDRSLGEYATFMREEFILQPKLMIRQTADRFIAAYDDQNYFLLNTLYACLSRNEKLELKYILALLNSKLLNFLYHSLIHEGKKLFPQMKIYHIQNSPIKIENLGTQKHFIGYVNHIEYLNKEYNCHKYKHSSIEKEITKQQHKLDYLVYQLFELTHREIEEIESIYAEI
ncbi:TaqI-like C-terminal specificity domain-containing protein [Geosporobacter ferrireducens]|uniref:site-specific DNA-methyltransferase (adenine-specific) n=1 Tax=Geosporobacter ferrireducens TaxID=1424294 RepID=A0A1D8GD51_9FIRM|nr:TaqI-like C-terminal specificity domain-containing protein [Geosporobacter ferrireducens]AOT68835.1 hypothetical protein Gferi_04270 [Geosporobacter ferrireducens]MTI56500.1 hypothetical protein [Geosporobacter ferrireducens]